MFLCNKFRAIIYKDLRYISVHKTIRFLLSVMLVWVAVTAKAQYDAAFSHYFDMETSFNPAAAGKENKLNVNLAYALNFTGFENHPRTMYASADLPFYAMRCYQGAGVQFVN